MALSATVLKGLIVAEMDVRVPTFAASPYRNDVINGLIASIAAAVIDHITTSGTVSFVPTQIIGTDVGPSPATHETLSASGGKIT